MSDSISAQETIFQFPWGRAALEQTRHDALTAELQVARAREKAWLREKSGLLRRQDILAQEFEHRFLNSLQIIGSLLSLQSRDRKSTRLNSSHLRRSRMPSSA